MSFRLFIYYCAVCGGWAAFVGFLLGTLVAPENPVGRAGILGMFVGLMVAIALAFVDAVWSGGFQRIGRLFLRAATAGLLGAIAGLIGGILAQVLSQAADVLRIMAWALAGLAIGASIAVFELVDGLIQQTDVTAARKKLVKCLAGGCAGGALGALLAVLLSFLFTRALSDRDPSWLWSPTAMGFVALGMCIGLLVGLAQRKEL